MKQQHVTAAEFDIWLQVRLNVASCWDASMLLLSDMVLVASGLAKLNVAVKDCLTGEVTSY